MVSGFDAHGIFFVRCFRGLVSTVAGSGAPGSDDGIGTGATFDDPVGVAADAAGNIYVGDFDNHKIRRVSPFGEVSTFAGSGTQGSNDGTGTAASFLGPTGVAVDGDDNVYVADYGNHTIRKISPAGEVTTFAGSGSPGSADGTGTAASFDLPHGVAVDTDGNVYVADFGNHTIRKITPAGEVTTFAGSGSPGSSDGTGTAAEFDSPRAVALDTDGNIYVADALNHAIRKITPSGEVTTFAGDGMIGSDDGPGTVASFNFPSAVAVDADGNVYVTDTNNHSIRKITPSGEVTTLAGNGTDGAQDGTGATATFSSPFGVMVDATGNLYIADRGNHTIRKIS